MKDVANPCKSWREEEERELRKRQTHGKKETKCGTTDEKYNVMHVADIHDMQILVSSSIILTLGFHIDGREQCIIYTIM